MGLKNASQQFQQMMDNLLEEVSDVATPFIDYILIGTKAEPGEDLYEKHYKDVVGSWTSSASISWLKTKTNVKCL